jgi:hypothetical protein
LGLYRFLTLSLHRSHANSYFATESHSSNNTENSPSEWL